MTVQWTSESLLDFHSKAQSWARTLVGNEIILLTGDLGAGKTEFVKASAKIFGATDVVSPTFALHRQMVGTDQVVIDHFDLYRLQNLDEIETSGLFEIFQETSLLFVEWPERLPAQYWPQRRKRFLVSISIVDEAKRQVQIKPL